LSFHVISGRRSSSNQVTNVVWVRLECILYFAVCALAFFVTEQLRTAILTQFGTTQSKWAWSGDLLGNSDIISALFFPHRLTLRISQQCVLCVRWLTWRHNSNLRPSCSRASSSLRAILLEWRHRTSTLCHCQRAVHWSTQPDGSSLLQSLRLPRLLQEFGEAATLRLGSPCSQ
jgi:hypothetical protein